MQTEKQTYTISIYTEDIIGLLNRITIIFTRRHININSLSVSHSEIDDVSKFNVVAVMSPDSVHKVAGQIEKQIEVISVFYHTNDEIISRDLALIKLQAPQSTHHKAEIHAIVANSQAVILEENTDFWVIEDTDFPDKTQDLHQKLQPYGVMQFIRSGSIAISREEMVVSAKLD